MWHVTRLLGAGHVPSTLLNQASRLPLTTELDFQKTAFLLPLDAVFCCSIVATQQLPQIMSLRGEPYSRCQIVCLIPERRCVRMAMKREWLLRDISQVDRLLERAADNIALQKQIVIDLAERGHAAMAIEARHLLATFQTLHKQHTDHRERLLRELATLEANGMLLAAE